MSAAVGADIEALCSKCGDVWHVVVAKVGDQIVKVHCKECNKEHRYKNPHGQPKAVRQPSLANPKPVREPKAPVERFDKPLVAADLQKPVRTYRASEHYDVGDRVDHPNFGQGVVEISEDTGKITVFFAQGRRVLVQAKAATKNSLERPKPFDHSNTAGGKPVNQQ
ncbi:MAG: hypothetical protein QM831_19840 [Kofleriaceae bacterium]